MIRVPANETGPGVNFPPLNSHVGIRYAASSCLTCDRCLAGGETSCLQAKVSGFYTPGTFQQFVVSDARCVTLVPEGLDMAMVRLYNSNLVFV